MEIMLVLTPVACHLTAQTGAMEEFMPSNRNCSSKETAGGGRGGRIKQKLILGVGSNGDCVPALGPQV